MSYQSNSTLQKLIAQKLVLLAHKHVDLANSDILDIGCGTGFIAQSLIGMYGNILQADVNLEHLNFAQHFGDAIQMDFNKPISINKKFDVILSSMALQWAIDLKDVIFTLQNNALKEGSKKNIFFAVPLEGSLQAVYDVLQIKSFNYPKLEDIQKHSDLLCIKYYHENAYIALKNIHISRLKVGKGEKINKNQLSLLKKTQTAWKIGFFVTNYARR